VLITRIPTGHTSTRIAVSATVGVRDPFPELAMCVRERRDTSVMFI